MAVLPGVIDVTTNYLEHPEVVADRICQWVDAVGDPGPVREPADIFEQLDRAATIDLLAIAVLFQVLGILLPSTLVTPRRPTAVRAP